MVSECIRYGIGSALFLATVSILLLAPAMLISLNRDMYEPWVQHHPELKAQSVRHLVDDVLWVMEGNEISNIVFSQAEKDHLYDVAALFSAARMLIIASVLVLVFFGILFAYKDQVELFLLTIMIGGIVAASIAIIVAIAAWLDFVWVFEKMHELLFPQGNWRFPESAVLVRIFPQSLFKQFATTIVSTTIGVSIVVAGLARFIAGRAQLQNN